ncbi:hypothetical protein KSS87_013079 [Heliosperma pusillum]|nr:hypothetical protein KSS87_013079 [Heliosperma pusillum]
MENDIQKVLWTANEIAERVTQLATELTRDLSSEVAGPPVFIGVATGAFLFLADLVRQVSVPLFVDTVRASSYGLGTHSNGSPTISDNLKLDISAKHVVLVEDIVDTGNTVARLIAYLESKGASSVSVCTFLDKPSQRKATFNMVGKGKFYRGFECPDYFVVGYGMDFAELYRNLPYVGVLKPECYKGISDEHPKN